MDDKNFQKDSAEEWIAIIEESANSLRDHDIYPLLQRWIETNNPTRILDIGCGQGICASKLSLEDCQYVGVDASPVLIERAKHLFGTSKHDFVLGNVYSLPFPTASFDAVFSVALWHLLENSQQAAFEVSRVLKPSGSIVLIMADPSAYSAWIDQYQEKKIEGKRFEGRNKRTDGSFSSDILYLRSKEEILSELEQAGIRITRFESFRNQVAYHGHKI